MSTVESILRVLVVGLALGAGLPAVFAIGIRINAAAAGTAQSDGTTGAPNLFFKGIAYLLFAIIAAVILVGILWITRGTIDYYLGINLFPFVES